MNSSAQKTPPFGPGSKNRPRPWRLLACCAALAALDFASGPLYAVSVFFVLPVIYAAWYYGLRFACGVAAALGLLRFASNWAHGFPMSMDTALVNNLMRVVTLMLVAFLTEQLASQMRLLKRRLKQLEDRLPICPDCGCACDREGRWLPLDDGTPLSTTTYPRSLCPECERRRYDVQPG